MKNVFLILFSFLSFITSNGQNTWTQLNNYAGVPTNGSVSFTIDSITYVGLGWNFSVYSTNFYAYDPITDSWSSIANFPGAGRHTAVAFTIGNKGYVGTGYNGTSYFNDFYEYNPSTNTWTQIANLGGLPRAGAVAFSLNGIGYVGTGTASSLTYLIDFWAYNPSTNTWTQKNNFGGTARRYASAFVIGNKSYVGTGQGSTGHGPTFFEYEPVTDTWTQKTSLPFGRSGCMAFSVGSEGYLGGGYNGTTYQTGFQKYDPVSNTWTAIANFGGGTRAYASSFSMNGYGYICAGYGSTGLKNDLWRYSPALGYSYSQTNVTCNGGNDGSITITATGGVPPYSYSWSPNIQDTTDFVDSLSIGSYSCQITDDLNNTVTTNITITESAPLIAMISASDTTAFCSGDSVILSANAASNYQWSNGDTTQNITANSAGNYSVFITDANGCFDTSDITSITVFNLPTANITASGPTFFCQGDSVIISSDPFNSYLWSNNETTQNISVTTSGSFSVTVTDGNGCSQTSSGISVTVNSLPDANITPAGPTSFCQGDSVQLSVTAANSYLWSTNETTQQIYVYSSGTYSVTITDGNGCTSLLENINITVFPLPSTPVITANGTVLTSSSTSGNQWFLNGNIISGANSQNYTVTQNGIYTVVVSDGNGCSSASSPFNFNSVGFTENINEIELKIFPNPSAGIFQLETNGKNISEIKIYNISGEIIYSNTGNAFVDISAHPVGVYFAILNTSDVMVFQKLIVVR